MEVKKVFIEGVDDNTAGLEPGHGLRRVFACLDLSAS